MRTLLTALLATTILAAALNATARAPASSSASASAPLIIEVDQGRTLASRQPIQRIVVDGSTIVEATLKSPREITLKGLAAGVARISWESADARQTLTVHVRPKGAGQADAIGRRLNETADLKGVTVEAGVETPIAKGAVTDLESWSTADTLAKAYGAGEVSAVKVTGQQMVAVDVQFIVVASRTLRQLGFNFTKIDNGFQGGLFAPGSLQSYQFDRTGLQLDTSSPLSGAFDLVLGDAGNGALGLLSALSGAGLSQVLAQPTLLVRSGETADFLAGGEVPIPVPQSAGGANGAVVTIEYRPYGVRLDVAPVVMSDGRIILKLSPEVSEIDYANGVQLQGFTVPGFRRRSASTTVQLGDGQSYIIAGLSFSASSATDNAVPGLGSLPVIGSLFKARENTLERQELIIVATPRLVDPLDPEEARALINPPKPSIASETDLLLNIDTTGRKAKRFGLQ
ncbi:pilus assembly protein N-terminal domain-containing protein [Caulobacter segnis]|uniref:type II and III secretion system protein family protein n=1 Tax=Caulobacter segnis TaxID=88688 RepID=UPI00240EF0F9|nr:pilus assembly protein N-terminal domain-containing protein [Caulobacter segnis]MDG2520726.1 pilus assembly protein N-terminal domain-containing protein [Caulobacter segnis]